MADARLIWRGDQVKRQATDKLIAKMRQAAADAKAHLQERVSKPYPPSGPEGGYAAMRTGNFRGSVYYRTDRARRMIRIGARAAYARFLEFGTRFMAPRPNFRLVLRYFRDRLKAILGKRSSGGVK